MHLFVTKNGNLFLLFILTIMIETGIITQEDMADLFGCE
nr:MAG TPA_asm: Photoprotection regulator fluorescence recovery protein [Caudoviricetes sp.]DAU36787.1 MAG TPA: Photoprotection regulator fluorescence recovery protein [Caudoviricetes sp.]